MRHVTSTNGTRVTFEVYGSGPPLLLVHGSFSDQRSNWEFVAPLLSRQFMVHAVARRGRGQTDATIGHRLEDEAQDVAAIVRSIDEPVFLLGHSYGAQVALAAALELPGRLRKLVLYEAPWPNAIDAQAMAGLEALGRAGDWERFALTFFGDLLAVPAAELEGLRASELWPPIIADAKATLGDLRALTRYAFDAERFRALRVPVLLQTGSESPREIYVTDALAAVLPDVRVEALPGQAHEGMTTAPELYCDAVSRFLLQV
ncbi:alpha/beta fold hydrolase [Rivibacter subsaxonicus]|uniref:Pimeloyl-ACP methyl ester carboxylesterase n=1 Tax=Rivibacter subsaxonicus TaxID=457575 RepID=A0A4V2FS52_9BURK|nr:alpha/beta hydrolase [Rivibacter subsaxonicus]RZT92569.1 pimeloyl-ACP methyl ester carboxylesterase [Rivibacter subsaxonicus]